MTRKSYAITKLPLLGSNQDSPDPESAGFRGSRGKSDRVEPENRGVSGATTHGFTHGVNGSLEQGANTLPSIDSIGASRRFCADCDTSLQSGRAA